MENPNPGSDSEFYLEERIEKVGDTGAEFVEMEILILVIFIMKG